MIRTACATLLLALIAQPAIGDDWTQLFNGTDLTGWRANNDPESFTVVDGLLRVQANGKTAAHLFFVGDHESGLEAFKNFELKAVARSEPNANGGIFFHTDMSVRNAQQHLANGYEVQLNSSQKETRKTGSLYAIVDLPTSPVDETEWFTVRIVVRDQRITVIINDQQVVDYTEPPDPQRPKNRAGRILQERGGAIALQAHDSGSIWYFKDIRVKRLP